MLQEDDRPLIEANQNGPVHLGNCRGGLRCDHHRQWETNGSRRRQILHDRYVECPVRGFADDTIKEIATSPINSSVVSNEKEISGPPPL